MKLNLDTCSSEIDFIVHEVKQILNIEIDASGIILSALPSEEEGYQIVKESEHLTIRYHHLSDFNRGLLTAISKGSEPDYIFKEARSIEEFGIMLDMSRNAVMTVNSLKRFVRYAALMGYNFLGIYMEDTIQIPDEPYFGYMRGALTKKELREMDEYAIRLGLELRPYIQTLAHLNQITRYEEYQKIIDTEDILLAGEERTYELIERLLQTISETFTCRKINIGMDEAHMVGLGKYLDKNGYSERSEIMLNHLKRVIEIGRNYNFQFEMWSDMFFRLAYQGEYYVTEEKEPIASSDIPEGLTLAYWDYYSLEKKHYADMLKQHKKITNQISYAGMAWRCTGFTPHNRYSFRTGKASIQAARENKINRVVIACWGDNGAEGSNFMVLPALYMNAEYVYSEDDLCDKTDKSKFQILTKIALKDFLLVDEVTLFNEDDKKHNNSSKYFLYNDPLIGTFDSLVPKDVEDHYKKVSKEIKEMEQNKEFGYLFTTQRCLLDALELKASLGIKIRDAYLKKDKDKLKKIADTIIPEVLNRIESFYQAMNCQWMKENKSFGFEVQCIRLGGLIKRLQYVQNVIFDYINGEIMQIDELEVETLPFEYFKNGEIDSLNYNLWHDIVSPAAIG